MAGENALFETQETAKTFEPELPEAFCQEAQKTCLIGATPRKSHIKAKANGGGLFKPLD